MTPVKSMTDRDLYRISVLYDLPDFVKAASAAEILGEVSDPVAHYADPQNRAYCTSTKAATWVSYAHFLDAADHCTPEYRSRVEGRLDEAARYFRLQPAIADLRSKHASLVEFDDTSLPDSHFAWVVKDASGATIERRLRLLNRAEIEKAAGWLLQHRDAYTYPDRMKIARRILVRAGEERAAVPVDALDKIAGYGSSTTDSVIDAVVTRIGILRTKRADARIVDSLVMLRDTLEQTPAALRDREHRAKLASLLDQLDRDNDLQVSYARDGLERPEETIFGITQKVAEDFLGRYIHTKSGAVYLRSDLDGADLASLGRMLGAEFAERLSDDGITLDSAKTAAATERLSAPETQMLEDALAQLGVTPVERLTSPRTHAARRR
jgi:hypothetical protein